MRETEKRLLSAVLTVVMMVTMLAVPSISAEETTAAIYDIRVNDLQKPVGIDDNAPTFSWKMDSDAIGAAQTAYSIVVTDGITELWNTDWVTSGDSIGIEYAGEALAPSTEYTIKLSVKDQNDATLTAESTFETGLMGAVNDAQWISVNGSAGNANSLPAFRKSFTANDAKEVKSAKLYTSALGVYESFVNGQRVGRLLDDGTVEYHELKPGYTEPQERKFYSAYDITHMLKSGQENVLSAEVSSGWWSGTVVNLNKGSVDAYWAKLILTYADGSSETIVTDTSWRVARQSPVQKGAGIFPGESYDARISTDWRLPEYDDSAWNNAKINTEFTGELVAYDGEYVTVRDDLERTPQQIYVYSGVTGADDENHGKVVTLRTYKDGDSIVLNPGETLVVDFGQNFAGWEAFDVTAEEGTTIHVEHGEMLNDGNGAKARGCDGPEGSVYNTNYRSNIANTNYITSGNGVESYHPSHTYYGFRYAAFTADNTATLTNIRGQVVTSVKEDTAWMTTSNEDVNQLLSNIRWSMYSNYLSVPTDCPQRTERMGWTGDAQIFAEAGSYLGNNKSFMEKYLTDMRDVQISDESEVTTSKPLGAYSTIAPTGSYSSTSWGDMGWADAGVIIPYYIYMMYGDTDTIAEHWDSMVLYMDEYLGSTEGLGGKKSYGDHMHYERNDDATKPLLAISYYAWDALLMSEMATALGKTEDAAKYQAVYEAEKALYQEKYVNTDGTLKYNVQTLLLYALYLDLLPDQASVAAVTNQLITNIENNGNKLKTGFLGTAIILNTLSKIGRTDVAYKLLLQHNCPSWLYTVDNGATTIWERWDAYTSDSGIYGGATTSNAKSFNHYSFGAVSSWMFRDMAGVGYDKSNPGFKHIVLAPKPSLRLPSVEASYESVYGTIVSNMNYGENVWNYSCTIPANTTATIKLPVEDITTLTADGKTVQSETIDGLTYLGYENGIATFEAVAGSYTFSSKVEYIQTATLDIDADASVPIDAEILLNGEPTATTLPATLDIKDGDVIIARVSAKNSVDYAITKWTMDGSVISEGAELTYTVSGYDSLNITAHVEKIGYNSLAVGKTVETEFFRADWAPAYLTDGILNSLGGNRGWSSVMSSLNLGKSTTFDPEVSAIIDLGDEMSFNRFQIYPRDYDVTEGNLWNFPVAYTISISDDKTEWTPVYTTEDGSLPENLYTPVVIQLNKNVSGRYVKLGVTKITRGDQSNNCYVQLSEFGVYSVKLEGGATPIGHLDENGYIISGMSIAAAYNENNTSYKNEITQYPTAQMIDGDVNTMGANAYYWTSMAGGKAITVIDLGAEYEISKVSVIAPTLEDASKAAATAVANGYSSGYTQPNVNAVVAYLSTDIPTPDELTNYTSASANIVRLNTGDTDNTIVNGKGWDPETNESSNELEPGAKYRYLTLWQRLAGGQVISEVRVKTAASMVTAIIDDAGSIIAAPVNIPTGSIIIIACYKDDMLTGIETITYDGSPTASYTPDAEYDSAKVFALDSLDSMIPLCDAEDVSKPQV